MNVADYIAEMSMMFGEPLVHVGTPQLTEHQRLKALVLSWNNDAFLFILRDPCGVDRLMGFVRVTVPVDTESLLELNKRNGPRLN